MKNEYKELINISLKYKRREYLKYISFIKFFAMIIIIKWHLVRHISWGFRVGGRMVEILFVSSGFLVGYNYFNVPINSTYDYSFKYTYKHLRVFYPLYLINTIINLAENKIIYNYINRKPFSILTNIEIILIKITLLQTWSRYIDSIFNEASWFISALFLSYFLSPLLLKGIKNIKISVTLFFTVFFTLFLVEYFVKNGAINLFQTNIYFGPIIRLLEFYMGMLMIPLFFYIKIKFNKIIRYKKMMKVLFTIIQIFAPIQQYFIMQKYNYLYNCYHVIFCCFFIFIIANDLGYLSNIINNKILSILMSCQYEMYILQFRFNFIFKSYYYLKLKNKNILYKEIFFHLNLLLIFLISYVYKILLKDKLAKLMDNILLLITKIFY